MKKILLLIALFCAFLGSSFSPAFAADNTIDLSGTWRVRLDPKDAGIRENWQKQEFKDKIKLPGSLPESGYGDDPSMRSPWMGTIKWDEWNKPQYAPYKTPDNFKMPFWLQPDKVYVGSAWYQKEVEIPGKWRGKRIVLHLERPHWETRVWVDDKEISTENSLSIPHLHDLSSALTPGKHRITVRVDNRMIVNVGSNSHSVSDHTQSNWNGLTGELKLAATAPVWIDDIQVYPNAKNKSAKVVVKIGNMTGKAGKGTLKWEATGENAPQPDRRSHTGQRLDPTSNIERPSGEQEISWNEKGGNAELNISLGPNALLWDEFSPNLYILTISLDTPNDNRSTSFGLRDFKVKGTRFTINDRNVFLRGTLECCIFPLTGYPPADVDYWRKIIRTCKAHGLNHMRFHSWCPPEAAFIAADELGFYYQVECSSWANGGASIGNGEPLDKWLYEEGHRITRAYGNHPSFVMMAYGNEPAGPGRGGEYLSKWCTYWRKKDPRRLHTGGAGWPAIKENEYHNIPAPRIQAWGQGLSSRINAQAPETQTDYSGHVKKAGIPLVSHEIGQWCVYPNFDEIKKYTGVLKAKNFEIFRDLLKNNHMGDQAHDFLMASGKLQTLCYKEEIESSLRTAQFGGFQLLDIHDFPGQGTALVGILDPFWDPKPYVSPEEFRRFCNITVPLARMSRKTWTDSEIFTANIEVAHFGPKPIQNAKPTWKIISDSGKVMDSGTLRTRSVPIDNCIFLGDVKVPCSKLPAPAEYKLVVGLEGTDIENDWSFWVYPSLDKLGHEDGSGQVPGVRIVEHLDPEALKELENGGKVLLLADPRDVKSDVKIGFSSIFWNTAWTGGQAPHTLGILCDPKHPVFKEFPTDYHSNWQWWELIHGSAAMILNDMPPELRPLVQPIDTWFDAKRLGLLFEAEVNGGKLMVCSMDLRSDLDTRHVARQMRHSILQYMGSDRFSPKLGLTVEQAASLFRKQSPQKKVSE